MPSMYFDQPPTEERAMELQITVKGMSKAKTGIRTMDGWKEGVYNSKTPLTDVESGDVLQAEVVGSDIVSYKVTDTSGRWSNRQGNAASTAKPAYSGAKKGGYVKDTKGITVGMSINNAVTLVAHGKVELADLEQTACAIFALSERMTKDAGTVTPNAVAPAPVQEVTPPPLPF